jgi:hypothetical protein
MKNTTLVKISAAFTASAIITSLMFSHAKNNRLEIGQLWEDDHGNDPFSETMPTVRRVDAIKDGYVKYTTVRTKYPRTSSLSKGAFRICAHKLPDSDITCQDILDMTTEKEPVDETGGIKAGQVWVYKSNDPFNGNTFTKKVLEVKDGYVKYERNGSTCSSSILWFKACSKLVTP